MSLKERLLPLLGGSLLAQALQIATIPLLTRLYGPERYGEYGVFAAALLFASMLATLRYELAIQLPVQDGMAKTIAALSLAICCCVSILVFFLAELVVPHITNLSEIHEFCGLLALSTFLLGTVNILNALSLRFGLYRLNGMAKAVQVAVSVGSALLIFFTMGDGFGLIYGNLLSYLAANVLLFSMLRSRLCRGEGRGKLLRSFQVIAKRYRGFAIFNAPQAMLDGIRPIVIVSLIQASYGSVAAGYYHVANQLLQTPAGVITQSFSQVHFRYLVENIGRATIRPLIKKNLTLLLAIAMLGLTIVFLLAEPLTNILFGQRWLGLHRILEALVWVVSINLVVAPLVFIFHALKKHREFFIWGIFYNLIAIFSVVWACNNFSDVVTALLIYSTAAGSVLLIIGIRSVSLSLRSDGSKYQMESKS